MMNRRRIAILLGVALSVAAGVAVILLRAPGGDEVLLAAIPVQAELTKDMELSFRLEGAPPLREVSVRFQGGRGLYYRCEEKEGYTNFTRTKIEKRLYCDWGLDVLLNGGTSCCGAAVTPNPLTFRFRPDASRAGENRLLLKPNPSLMAESILLIERVEVWGVRERNATPASSPRARPRATPTSRAVPPWTPGPRVYPSSPIDNDHHEGGLGARVQVVLFFDFLDPPNRRFWTDALPRLREEYLDPGRAILYYRHFPLDRLSHRDDSLNRSVREHYGGSTPWALAAQCAREYGKFREMADKIFGALNWAARHSDPTRWEWVSPQGSVIMDENETREWPRRWAEEIGLFSDTFNACLDSRKYLADVEKDYGDGVAAGVRGTPALLVGSPGRGYVLVEGTPAEPQFNVVVNRQVGETLPYERLREVIEAELAAAGP
ncbi:MAG: thioredoxin domain-containing protein [Euryarchaeota archaeon]|nr:thioredoxin domain-containing protein [Euryarchaeota archaeon]